MDSRPFVSFPADGPDISDVSVSLLGDKGASLVRMAAAGLPVPPGFILPTTYCTRYYDSGKQLPMDLADAIREGLASLRRFIRQDQTLLVAVRSGAAQSMPGMLDTLLNVQGTFDDVIAAVRTVFDSWSQDRAIAYRREQGIGDCPGTAVTVQVMCPTQVAGVLFTTHPLHQSREQMLVEATRGQGDTVVRGTVTPDRFTLRHSDGRVITRSLADAELVQACLTDSQLVELAQLGRRVEQFFDHACDIEWGLTTEGFCLFQARPIRDGVDADELEELRRQTIARLADLAGGRRCAWVAHNLGETLPAPTPMTWAVIRQFMSGAGGYGRMYEALGYTPSPRVQFDGFLDLIAGRVYLHTERHAELFWGKAPFAYDLDRIRAHPRLAEEMPTRIDPSRVGLSFLLQLPRLWRRMASIRARIETLLQTADNRFEREILPPYLEQVRHKRSQDLRRLDHRQLVAAFEARRRLVMDDFGREAVLLSFLAGHAVLALRTLLGKTAAQHMPALLTRLAGNSARDQTVDADLALVEVAHGRRTRESYLETFGHRAAQAFELAQPRWREEPALFNAMSERFRTGLIIKRPEPATIESMLHDIGGRRFSRRRMQKLMQASRLVERYLPYRETAKNYWLMGYELLRLVLLEIDRRANLNGNVFYLTPEELTALLEGKDFSAVIAERRRRHRLQQRLALPEVIMSDDLDVIGRLQELPASGDTWQGTAISSGRGEGPALILAQPTDQHTRASGYVLVCPSTDPGWTPLFLEAVGLIVERGGMLSHGAIIARSLGIPAVVLPGATKLLKPGEHVAVDGSRGIIQRTPAQCTTVGQT